uniref:Uncharacterized protein n=1 Tax=Knipowitschia caucasica TaxID=637954 RepID=A0AAV2JNZ8_KNICA
MIYGPAPQLILKHPRVFLCFEYAHTAAGSNERAGGTTERPRETTGWTGGVYREDQGEHELDWRDYRETTSWTGRTTGRSRASTCWTGRTKGRTRESTSWTGGFYREDQGEHGLDWEDYRKDQGEHKLD